jgi:VanZ family protein
MISFLLSVKLPYRFALLIFYIAGIVALSLLPPQDLPKVQLFKGADKVIHLMMYLIFSILTCWTLKTEKHWYAIWLIIPVTIGWGILMEYIQLEMKMGRSFSWSDVMANTLGVLIGIIIYLSAMMYYQRKHPKN